MRHAWSTAVLSGLIATGSASFAAEQDAIDACIDKVREVGGPDGAGGGQVMSSDYSEAGTLVMLKDAGGTVWRCLASNAGVVEDISVDEAADDGGGAMAGSGSKGEVIHFPHGASGTILNGKISGRDDVDYILGARAGQTLRASIRLDSTNGDGTIYFNVLPPGSDGRALFVGSMEAEPETTVKLPASGDYIIRVYLMGNDKDAGKTVGYQLKVSVR